MKLDKNVIKSFALVTQIGISMLTPIFLCVYIGIKLDQWLETGYWFLIFVILGVIAAYRNVYYITRGFYAKNIKKESKNDSTKHDSTKYRDKAINKESKKNI